jgi:hypothetical protein
MIDDRSNVSRTSLETVSGYLAALGLFVCFIGMIWHPLRLAVPGLVVTLVAAGMAKGRLQLAAVLIGSVCLFLGLTFAVTTSHALW